MIIQQHSMCSRTSSFPQKYLASLRKIFLCGVYVWSQITVQQFRKWRIFHRILTLETAIKKSTSKWIPWWTSIQDWTRQLSLFTCTKQWYPQRNRRIQLYYKIWLICVLSSTMLRDILKSCLCYSALPILGINSWRWSTQKARIWKWIAVWSQ